MLHLTHKLQLTELERVKMRAACQFNAELMDAVRPLMKEGITTEEVDRFVYEYTKDHGHTPACLGYKIPSAPPFPKSCCTSVNEVVCHGIPGDVILKSGDIVNLDLTTIVNGWFGDQSETFLIGDCGKDAVRVTQAAFDCLHKGIDALRPGCQVAVIGKAIVAEASRRRMSVVQEFVGHGIGRRFHQEPSVPHYPTPQSRRDYLLPGMCFTIEPMINLGTHETVLDRRDKWTVRTKDGKLTAQFEHTIMMTETGPEIMTLTKNGPQKGHKFGEPTDG